MCSWSATSYPHKHEVRMWKHSRWTRSLPQIQSNALTFSRNYGERVWLALHLCLLPGALPSFGAHFSAWHCPREARACLLGQKLRGAGRGRCRGERRTSSRPLVDAHGSLWGSLQVLFEQEYANLIQNQHFFFFSLLSAVWMYSLAPENWGDEAVAALGLSTGCTLAGWGELNNVWIHSVGVHAWVSVLTLGPEAVGTGSGL